MTLFVWACGLTLAVVNTIEYVPQTARTLRRRDADGLSSVALVSGCIQYTIWNYYAWLADSMILFVTNILATGVYYALTFGAHRAGLRWTRACWIPTGWALVSLTCAALGATPLALALTVGSVISLAPAAWAAWREPSITGISVAAYLLFMLNACCYLVIGIDGAVLGAILSSIVALVTGGAVLAAVALRTQARHPATSDGEPDPALVAAVEEALEAVTDPFGTGDADREATDPDAQAAPA